MIGPEEILWIIFTIAFLYIYFIPSKIAYRKRMPNRFIILIINIFFGGTGFGWLVALALALSGNDNQTEE